MGLLKTSFIIEEFVPPETYEKWGDRSVWFINPNAVLFVQWLKDITGGVTVTINNWKWGGKRKYSGYRPPDCDIGADESSHKRKDAIDIIVEGFTSIQIRALIKGNFELLNERFGVTGYELDTDGWTHIDFRWTNSDKLYEIPIPK